MAGLFCNSPELQRLEKQMRQPPGYRARGHGSIEDMSEWKEMGAYSEIVDYVIDRMHLEYLKKRIGEIFDQTKDELFFYDSDHKKRFYLLWSGSKENTLSRLPNYAATVFYFLRMKNCGKKHAGRCQIPESILIRFGWEVLLWNNIFCSMRQKTLITGQSISACRN